GAPPGSHSTAFSWRESARAAARCPSVAVSPSEAGRRSSSSSSSSARSSRVRHVRPAGRPGPVVRPDPAPARPVAPARPQPNLNVPLTLKWRCSSSFTQPPWLATPPTPKLRVSGCSATAPCAGTRASTSDGPSPASFGATPASSGRATRRTAGPRTRESSGAAPSS
ncbi:hypothetical protein FOCC_FOCC010740, partial [Frankliniella occidentalis]